MEKMNDDLENNLKQLIQTSFQAKPDGKIRKRLLNDLLDEADGAREHQDFPELILYSIFGLFLLFYAIFFFSGINRHMLEVLTLLPLAILLINIIFLPISGITIISNRRGSNEK